MSETVHFDPVTTLETQLAQASAQLGAGSSAKELCDHLSRHVTYLRNNGYQLNEVDIVLNYCYWTLRQLEISQEQRSSALWSYSKRMDDYDQALGDCIPTEFKDRCIYHLARSAYQDNTNENAADDLDFLIGERSHDLYKQTPVPTGLKGVDGKLGGGISGLTFLGGDKGVGKTSLLLQCVLHALSQDPELGAVLYTFDTPKSLVIDRMLCMLAQVDFAEHDQASIAASESLASAYSHLHGNLLRRVRIVPRKFDYGAVEIREGKFRRKTGLCAEDVLEDCRSLSKVSGVTRLFLAFDLFQKIDLDGEYGDSLAVDLARLDMFQEIRTRTASSVHPRGYPILATSEIRKDTGKHLTRDSLKGDGRIAGDADAVLLLEQKKDTKSSDTVECTLCIDKGREGVDRGSVPLWFNFPKHLFHDSQPDRSISPTRDATEQVSENDSDPIDPFSE